MTKDQPPELTDMLMASGFMLEVFMLQMTLEFARRQDNPEAWARQFVSKLHERIDANEERTSSSDYPVHELARSGFDCLGQHLAQLLKLPPS